MINKQLKIFLSILPLIFISTSCNKDDTIKVNRCLPLDHEKALLSQMMPLEKENKYNFSISLKDLFSSVNANLNNSNGCGMIFLLNDDSDLTEYYKYVLNISFLLSNDVDIKYNNDIITESSLSPEIWLDAYQNAKFEEIEHTYVFYTDPELNAAFLMFFNTSTSFIDDKISIGISVANSIPSACLMFVNHLLLD